jgi:hypothetical protein
MKRIRALTSSLPVSILVNDPIERSGRRAMDKLADGSVEPNLLSNELQRIIIAMASYNREKSSSALHTRHTFKDNRSDSQWPSTCNFSQLEMVQWERHHFLWF